MSRLARDGTAELVVSRDQILRHGSGEGNIHFMFSADHEQDWQSDPIDPYSCYMCDHTYWHPHGDSVLLFFCLNLTKRPMGLNVQLLINSPHRTPSGLLKVV